MKPRTEIFDPRIRSEPELALRALHWGEANDALLVALHGGGANSHWWDHMAPAWARHFHVVALDFRGHGASTRPQTVESAAFRADLDALLAHLDARAPVLVGHSMGAGVALARAANDERLRGLVLLDPPRSQGDRKRVNRRMRLALSLRRSYATREEAVDRLRFLPSADHCSEALRRSIAEHSVAREDDGRWSYCFDGRAFGLPPARPRPNPGDVRCPTLIIRGADSPLLSAEAAASFAREFQQARLVEIPDAGHHVQLDRPDETVRAITTFLEALPPR